MLIQSFDPEICQQFHLSNLGFLSREGAKAAVNPLNCMLSSLHSQAGAAPFKDSLLNRVGLYAVIGTPYLCAAKETLSECVKTNEVLSECVLGTRASSSQRLNAPELWEWRCLLCTQA